MTRRGLPGGGYVLAVAGGSDVTPLRPVIRSVDRPHWWGVLAVALAVMALVAAITSTDRSSGPGRTSPTSSRPAPEASTPAPPGPASARFDRYTGIAGNLQHPHATYRAPVRGGTEHAFVHSPSAAAVRLAVACPGGQRVVVGRSDVKVGVPAGSGTCTIMVSSGTDLPAKGFHYTLLFDR